MRRKNRKKVNEITQPQTGCFSHQIEILFVIKIAKKNRKKEKQTNKKVTFENPRHDNRQSIDTYTRDPNTQ